MDQCQKDECHDMFAREETSFPKRGGVCQPTDGARGINDYKHRRVDCEVCGTSLAAEFLR